MVLYIARILVCITEGAICGGACVRACRYEGYDQKERPHINQADVALLQYPLGLRSNKRVFPALPNSTTPDVQLAVNDLLFWQPKSDNQVGFSCSNR
eukprot:COSAG05_NODE_1077_length_5955_cov_2.032787_4_plen_97_part_00